MLFWQQKKQKSKNAQNFSKLDLQKLILCITLPPKGENNRKSEREKYHDDIQRDC